MALSSNSVTIIRHVCIFNVFSFCFGPENSGEIQKLSNPEPSTETLPHFLEGSFKLSYFVKRVSNKRRIPSMQPTESTFLLQGKDLKSSKIWNYFKSDLTFIKYAFGTIIGTVGQLVLLPLFIATFGGSTGVYFIVFFASFLFNVIFWPIVIIQWLRKKLVFPSNYRSQHWIVVVIGICDALNGLLVVYSSVADRTPGALQAILSQSVIPFTLLFSIPILKKRYSGMQLVGGVLSFLGIVISLIPTFISIKHTGSFAFYWPGIFLIGNVPAVLMNIFEEKVFKDTKKEYDIFLLLAYESLYQFLTITLLFWVDIIPGFGTSKDLPAWWKLIEDGAVCFFAPNHASFHLCYYSAALGIFFVASYSFSYIYGSLVMKHASANSNALATTLSPLLVVIFWMIFPGVNKWAGGNPYTHVDLICNLCSLPPLLFGVCWFRYHEKKREESDSEKKELLNGAVTVQ